MITVRWTVFATAKRTVWVEANRHEYTAEEAKEFGNALLRWAAQAEGSIESPTAPDATAQPQNVQNQKEGTK